MALTAKDKQEMAAMIAMALQGNASTDDDDETPTKATSTRGKARKVIPTDTVKVGDQRFAFSAVLKSRSKDAPVTYRVPRVSVEVTNADGKTSNMPGTLSIEAMTAVREMDDDAFSKFVDYCIAENSGKAAS